MSTSEEMTRQPAGYRSKNGADRGERGVVAAGDPRTVEAGAGLLEAGGNAVDAAVGSALAAQISEPILTGPFGGGICMVAAPHDGVRSWSFFAKVPGLGLDDPRAVPSTDFFGAECSFGPTTQVFHIGRGSVAVPLLLPGLLALHDELGRLPMREVASPAMALAQSGAELSEEVGPLLGILEPILRHTREVESLFAPKGPLLAAPEIFHSPDLAGLLEQVSRGDSTVGQEGLLEAFGPPLGCLTKSDLEAARPAVEEPIRVNLGDYELSLPPPPASGGLLVAFSLSLMKRFLPGDCRDETTLALHLLAAMAATSAARREGVDQALLGDSRELVESFLCEEHVDEWVPHYERVLADGLPDLNEPPEPSSAMGSTTHVSVIDSDGMACSITHSNGEGSGHLVPGTGAMANNFLGEEDLHPGGFHSTPPGCRLTTMMCPAVVTRDGRAELALGSGGSNRIRSAMLQVLARRFFFDTDLERAVRLPRLHLERGKLYLERRGATGEMSRSTIEALSCRVEEVVVFESPNVYFGGVHAAAGGAKGAGDPRRGGSVRRG